MWGVSAKSKRALGLSAAMLACAMIGGSATAQSEDGFQSYLQVLRGKAQSAGVLQRTIDSVFPTLTMSDRVIELDRAQPGGSPNAPIAMFAPYKAKHVDAARIRRGQAAYQENRGKLARIEQETGVPESIMVSIWGHETNYGGYTGNFDLPNSLATLAYEGRRRSLFEGEFIDSLKIMDKGVSRDTLEGSWAGATGGPQFLPSVYLRLAADGDGDGHADIWHSDADVLASIGNYFVNAGWRKGQPWGFAVSAPTSIDVDAIASRTVPTRCAKVFQRHSEWKTMAEWRALGIQPLARGWPANDHMLATLLEPDGPGQTAYLLTGNYRVILDYNCSNFYALSVGLLADAVSQ
ncbi:lytic murein transglycosylase [Sphingomonas koreensis]|nr:lytic murein transglycosylase [Sphingomonas koreensis]